VGSCAHRERPVDLCHHFGLADAALTPFAEEQTLDFNTMSPLWTEFGFQRPNPVTDFRGGGLLSLEFLGVCSVLAATVCQCPCYLAHVVSSVLRGEVLPHCAQILASVGADSTFRFGFS
jgi:hypothetical protein